MHDIEKSRSFAVYPYIAYGLGADLKTFGEFCSSTSVRASNGNTIS